MIGITGGRFCWPRLGYRCFFGLGGGATATDPSRRSGTTLTPVFGFEAGGVTPTVPRLARGVEGSVMCSLMFPMTEPDARAFCSERAFAVDFGAT